MSQDKAEQANLRSFSHFLSTMNRGHLNTELSEVMENLIGDLNNHRQEFGGVPKGEITLKLTFKLDGGHVEVRPDLKVKTPIEKMDPSIYFVTPDNHLSRQDPQQHDMFRPVKDRASHN